MRTADEWLMKFPPTRAEEKLLKDYLESRPAGLTGWALDNILRANYLAYLRIQETAEGRKWGVHLGNPYLINDDSAMHAETFPRAHHGRHFLVRLACLILWFKRERDNHEVPAGQAAGSARDLRKLGFMFRTERGSKKYTCHNAAGEEVRVITHFDVTKIIQQASWNKLQKEVREQVKRIMAEDPTGEIDPLKTQEYDHRRPKDVWTADEAAELTLESLEDKSWDKQFQVVSKKYNDRKREVCVRCQQGKPIRLPPLLQPFAAAFLSQFAGSCEGCAWYNHLQPAVVLGAAHAAGLKAAQELHAAKLEQVARLARSYRERSNRLQKRKGG